MLGIAGNTASRKLPGGMGVLVKVLKFPEGIFLYGHRSWIVVLGYGVDSCFNKWFDTPHRSWPAHRCSYRCVGDSQECKFVVLLLVFRSLTLLVAFGVFVAGKNRMNLDF